MEVDPALEVAEVVIGRPVTGSVATCPSVNTALDSAMVPVDDPAVESPPKTWRTSCIKISPNDAASEGAVSAEGVAAVALSSVGVDPICVESASTLLTIAVVPAPRTPAIPAPIRRLLFMSSTLLSTHLGLGERKVKKRQRFWAIVPHRHRRRVDEE